MPLLEELYSRMVTVRRLEERLQEEYRNGTTRGPIHTCDGQEAVGIGAMAARRNTDVVTSTHRGHAHYVGCGMSLDRIVAEIFGRKNGYCRGRAGHMLIASKEHGMLGGNAIVGGGIPISVGHAWAFRTLKTDAVAIAFFGDGAAQTGVCHESMNIAALWKLPVVFICEHNNYGLTVPTHEQSSVENLVVRANAYGIQGKLVDGNDVAEVYFAVKEATENARRGDGPTLIEAKTYRATGFSTSDMGGYQSKEEIERWREKDPILRLQNYLEIRSGSDRIDEIEAAQCAIVDAAFAAALSSEYPDTDDLYSPEFTEGSS